MSRSELADAANRLLPVDDPDGPLTENDIGKIERGVVSFPHHRRRKALRTVLRVRTDEEIGLFNRRRRPTDVLPETAVLTESAVLADGAVVAEGAVLAEPSARPPAGAAPREPAQPASVVAEDAIDVLGRVQRLGRPIDPEIIFGLKANLNDAIDRYETLDQNDLVAGFVRQRRWIDEILIDCRSPHQQRQLYHVAGKISGMLGYAAVGRSDFPLARAYCAEAFQLGGFAEDADLQAWVRGLQGFCEYYIGNFDIALDQARDGLRHARFGAQGARLTIDGTESRWSRSLVMLDIVASMISTKQADLDHAAVLVLDALYISVDRHVLWPAGELPIMWTGL